MITPFPPSPSIGDEFDGYEWNGTAWVLLGIDLNKTYAEVVDGKISSDVIPETYAKKTYADSAVSTAISNLIDAAPSTLDTLNELAAAINDDPDFATTITALIATKLDSVPGMISEFAGTTIPTGWLLCDGQELKISSYQDLYNILTETGTVFPYGANTNGSGGAGSTYFRVPSLKGRIPVGRNSTDTEFDTLGEIGGVKTVTLDSTQMPVHSHANTLGSATVSAASHTHSATGEGGELRCAIGATGGDPGSIGYEPSGVISPGPGSIGSYSVVGFGFTTAGRGFSHYTPTYGYTSGSSADATVTISNVDAGGSGSPATTQPHNNLQPYVVLNYIIKY
jgi:microcystin-dependent protein